MGDAERDVSGPADTVAENAVRLLKLYQLAICRSAELIDHLAHNAIRADQHAAHQRLAAITRDVPLAGTIAVLGGDGVILTTANVYPVPLSVSYADREWFRVFPTCCAASGQDLAADVKGVATWACSIAFRPKATHPERERHWHCAYAGSQAPEGCCP